MGGVEIEDAADRSKWSGKMETINCKHCNGVMRRASRSESNMGMQVVGVILFFVGLYLLFVFPIGDIAHAGIPWAWIQKIQGVEVRAVRLLLRPGIAGCLAIILLPLTAWSAETFGPYDADVVRVIDGDTIELDVHVWPQLTQRINLRLDGVNTPEKRGSPECEKALARQASDFTNQFIGEASTVRLHSVRHGKYAGRALGRIEIPGKGFIGPALIEAGLAREYHGGARQPWCD